jgi:mannose/cellobiose epimerase-like protein (N-acyl-D-glucosamine 2-epimerase family)
MSQQFPNFESSEFLERHIQSTLAFYAPRVFAKEGGFYGCFRDDGSCYDPDVRQLVASCRYVFNYATAYRLYGEAMHLEWAKWGLNYLQTAHKQTNGAYVWQIEKGVITDNRVMAYGHAFVLLAAASCLQAGIQEAARIIDETYNFLERYFWDETGGAYFDERDASLATLSDYRGQNANMHMCEALLAAWTASGQARYLDRAEQLAHRFAFELASQSEGKIWEHYDADWHVDMEFNIDKPNDRYKPWGFQPGHQMEWAKLLLLLHEARPDEKWVSKAKSLFDQAMEMGWDKTYGGLVYGVGPDGTVCASEKYFWVQSESLAAAWRLYDVTGEEAYRQHYTEIWRWSWTYLIDHEYGAWFRVRNRDGSKAGDKKSPLGKTDYHTMGAVWDVLSHMNKTES